MRNNCRCFLLLALTLISLSPSVSADAFEAQGHRGARGLAPENTIAGFARALAAGVHMLELDVVMSADNELVVHHDLTLSPHLARGSDGNWIEPPAPALRSMTWAQIKKIDVGRIKPGSRYARRFAKQQAVDGTGMPKLSAVLDWLRNSGADHVGLNIETKINPLRPELSPRPEALAEALVNLVKEEAVRRTIVIQSFDWRTLRRVQEIAPQLATSYLSAQQIWLDNIQRDQDGTSPWTAGRDVDDHAGSVPRLIKSSGGRIWSPFHRDLTAASLKTAHELGLKVIAWTVNDGARMHELIRLGVDGIISDYPDVLFEIMREAGIPTPPQIAR